MGYKTAERLLIQKALASYEGTIKKCHPAQARGLANLKYRGQFGGARAFVANMAHRGGVGNGGVITSPMVGKYGRVRS